MASLDESARAMSQALSFYEEGRLEDAEAICRDIVAARPDSPRGLYLLGIVEGRMGRLRPAIEHLTRAAAVAPAAPQVFSALSKFLLDANRAEDAVAAARTAVRLDPAYAEASSNLAAALNAAGRTDEGLAAADHAVRLSPTLAAAYHNLANAQRAIGRVDLAVASYRTAIRLQPDALDVHHDYLNALRYDPAFDARAILAETRAWADRHVASLARAARPHANDRSPERRLRVGYVSPDLRDHPVGLNMLPLYRSHDRRAVEVFTYSGVGVPDAITAEFQTRSDHWRSTVGLAHAQVAARVRADAIDILVDLSLHTSQNRLLAFALKPAPVQVTFAGYPGTTGVRAIDYRLTDPLLDPPGENDDDYTEASIRLPRTFWCIDPMADDVPVSPLPAGETGAVTFGCLNDFTKVNDGVLGLWAAVLRAVPGSTLVVACPEGPSRRRVLDRLDRDGVRSDRVTFHARMPRRDYLRAYHAIDIALDTVPYNGHTTSLDAFWMGVPVVSIVGPTVVGRAGLSQADNLGLAELVGRTPDAFVEIARRLAGDRAALSHLRQTLRERMRRSPLMDGDAFARGIETAYREMWRRWCEGGSNASTEGNTSGSATRSNW